MRSLLLVVLVSIPGSPALSDQTDSRLDALLLKLAAGETTRNAARVEEIFWWLGL